MLGFGALGRAAQAWVAPGAEFEEAGEEAFRERLEGR